MHYIDIKVEKKKAWLNTPTEIICDNSDYVINFTFDAEWDEHAVKTARFFYNGSYDEVVFEGNTCSVPVISKATGVFIGIFAGDIYTSTPAYVPCVLSILGLGGKHADPPKDVYDQIMELIKGLTVEKGIPSDALPLMDGEAKPGTAMEYSRGDHTHPTDTSRASAEEVERLREIIENSPGGEMPDLEGYVTDEELGQKLSGYAKTEDIPSLDGYAKTDDIPSIAGLATEKFVTTKIAEAQLEGKDVDLTGYATEDWVEGKGYLTDQDLSGYAKTEDIPSLEGYAKTSDIPSLDGYAKTSDIPSLEGYAKTSDIPSLEGYAKTDDIPSLEGYATEKYVDDKFAEIELPEGEIVNANYEENDPNSPAYIENRPFYDTREVTEEGEEIGELKKLNNIFLDLPANEDFKALEKEVDTAMGIALGAERAESYQTLPDMITELNGLDANAFKNNDNINIVAMKVPDFWVVRVEETPKTYVYQDDATLIDELITVGTIQVGHYVLARRETGKINLEDHPTYDDLTDYVKKTDYATTTTAGVVIAGSGLGMSKSNPGQIYVSGATRAQIAQQKSNGVAITPNNISYVVKIGLTENLEPELTYEEKAKAQKWLGIEDNTSNEILDFFKTNGTMGLEYTLSDSGTSGDCSGIGSAVGGDIVIGSMVRGARITEVYDNAFQGQSIHSVTLPEGIVTICEGAFQLCDWLKKVYLPKTLKNIFTDAFLGSAGITDVYYAGTEEEWNGISIQSGNECLTNANIHYNYTTEG